MIEGRPSHSRPAKTKKTHFGRHGMLMQSYHTRSIRHRILKNIRADDTLDLTFQGHFQGHKVKKRPKMTIFIYNVILLGVNSSHPC